MGLPWRMCQLIVSIMALTPRDLWTGAWPLPSMPDGYLLCSLKSLTRWPKWHLPGCISPTCGKPKDCTDCSLPEVVRKGVASTCLNNSLIVHNGHKGAVAISWRECDNLPTMGCCTGPMRPRRGPRDNDEKRTLAIGRRLPLWSTGLGRAEARQLGSSQ